MPICYFLIILRVKNGDISKRILIFYIIKSVVYKTNERINLFKIKLIVIFSDFDF